MKLIRFFFIPALLALPLSFAQEFGDPLYSGPAVLSRGTGATIRTTGSLVGIRPFVSFRGIYDGGLTPVSVGRLGELQRFNGSGVEVGFGAQGYKQWRRTLLSLNYNGNYRHYPNVRFFNGTDQQLGLTLAHELSRKWGFNLRTATGSLMRGFLQDNVLGTANVGDSMVTFQDPFDNRITFTNTMGAVRYSPSVRLSFSFGGGGFLVRRRSAALFGVDGVMGTADMAYRLTRRQTIGVSYAHNYWNYTRGYGNSMFDYVALNYSVLLSRNWELGLQAGGYRTNSKGIGVVQLDPAVAAILGTSTGFAAFDRTNYVPGFSGRLVRQWQRASLSFDATSNVMPGNSLFLTSRQQSGTISYSYGGIQGWGLRFFGGINSFSALMQDALKQTTYFGGAGVSRRLGGPLQFTVDAQIRRVDISQQTQFNRDFLRISVGLVFSPGDIPISLW